jgi:hypothetical protein
MITHIVLQTFITDYIGVPLTMEPNFEDYSCQVSSPFSCMLQMKILKHQEKVRGLLEYIIAPESYFLNAHGFHNLK